MSEHVGHDTTRSNSVHTDVLVTHVCAESSDESLDGVLGTSIERVVLWSTSASSDRGHQDDGSFHLEVLVGLLSNEELRSSVCVEYVVVDLWGDLEKRSEVLLSGVGHDNVETAESLLALLEESEDIWDLGDISLNGDSVRAKSLDPVSYTHLTLPTKA